MLLGAALLAGCAHRALDPANDAVDGGTTADMAQAQPASCPARLDAGPTADVVQCNAGLACPPADGCCEGGTPHCGDGSAGAQGCVGPWLRCDGPEDCAPGVACVLSLGFVREQDQSICSNEVYGTVVCHHDADCPAGSACLVDYSYFAGAAGLCLDCHQSEERSQTVRAQGR